MTGVRVVPDEERKRWFGKYSGEIDDELMEFDEALTKVAAEVKELNKELMTPVFVLPE